MSGMDIINQSDCWLEVCPFFGSVAVKIIQGKTESIIYLSPESAKTRAKLLLKAARAVEKTQA